MVLNIPQNVGPNEKLPLSIVSRLIGRANKNLTSHGWQSVFNVSWLNKWVVLCTFWRWSVDLSKLLLFSQASSLFYSNSNISKLANIAKRKQPIIGEVGDYKSQHVIIYLCTFTPLILPWLLPWSLSLCTCSLNPTYKHGNNPGLFNPSMFSHSYYPPTNWNFLLQ
jgi:hypothetical protein